MAIASIDPFTTNSQGKRVLPSFSLAGLPMPTAAC